MILQHNKVFVQIGTNNGNDNFLKLVKRNKPSKIILVEPNKSCIPKIQNNYKGIENVFIENVAITKTDKGLVKLVIPKNKRIYGNPATSVCYSLIPMDDWGDDFHSIEAHGMTFKSLCEKHGLNDIHYLQIDTEGYDSEIIKSIDFDQISIDYIKYEIWSFEETAFTRHGEESKLYGVNGMKASLNLLESAGYSVVRDGNDMIATKNT